MWVTVACEGIIDLAVLDRLLAEQDMHIAHSYVTSKQQLDPKLRGYNAAASHSPWVVLRDLDQDAPCAPPLIARLLPSPSPLMRFRIAVRAVEAWLLADRQGISNALGIARNKIPAEPERLDDPKRELINLARQSRQTAIQQDLVPREGSGRRVGPGYTGFVIAFVQHRWDPVRASERAPSLARLRRRLAELAVGLN